jgi:acyl-coenzyme A thioesterase PaaI-like protein
MATFIDILRNPFQLKLFFITKLPMALLAGLRIEAIDQSTATISLKYGYLTKNPFKSLYFACLAMAAELASGVLVWSGVADSKKNISMLVTGMEAEFTKKAIGKVAFCCEDRIASEKIQETIDTKAGVTLQTKSTGKDAQGDIVAIFKITWSMKVKG